MLPRAAIIGALILSGSCGKTDGGGGGGSAATPPVAVAKAGSGSGGGFSADLAQELGGGGSAAAKPDAGAEPAKAGSAAEPAKAGSGAAGSGALVGTPEVAKAGSGAEPAKAGSGAPAGKPPEAGKAGSGVDAGTPPEVAKAGSAAPVGKPPEVAKAGSGAEPAKAGSGAAPVSKPPEVAKAGSGAAPVGKPPEVGAADGSAAAKAGSAAGQPPEVAKAGSGAGSAKPVAVAPPVAPEVHAPVKLSAELAAIKLSLLPNWDRDVDAPGTFQYVVRIKGTQSTKTFLFRYGYDDAKAPVDRDQYKKYLQDTGTMTGEIRDRQRGSAWFLEGADANGAPSFRYVVLYGGKRLICFGSQYKDADSNRLGDDRDQTVIQAKQICETLAL